MPKTNKKKKKRSKRNIKEEKRQTGATGDALNWKIYNVAKFKRNADRGDYKDSGLGYGMDSKKYRQVQCWADEPHQHMVDPNEKNASNAYFNIRVAKKMAMRPHPKDFILLWYYVTVSELTAGADETDEESWGAPVPMNADHESHSMFYMNRSTFLSDCITDCKIDWCGVNVLPSGAKQQMENAAYNHIERSLCSDSVYQERMGRVDPPIRVSKQFEQALTRDSLALRSSEQISSQIPLSFLNKEMRRVATGTVDGLFLLGQPTSPILKSIREKRGVPHDETEFQWIPPDTEMRISFTFEDPATLGHKLEMGGNNNVEANYFTDVPAATPPKYRAFVHITDIKLNFESRPLTEEMNNIYSAGHVKLAYTWDMPYHISRKFPGGLSSLQTAFDVKAGTEIAYICFKHAHQKSYMPNQNKHMSHRCVRPPMLDSVELKLNDRPLFEQQKNLQDLRQLQGPFNPTCINYYSTLVNKGLCPFPLETLFPEEKTNVRSYCFILVVDLSLHRANSTQLLHIRCNVTGRELSPGNFDIDYFGVKQAHILQAITTTDKGGVQMSVAGPF